MHGKSYLPSLKGRCQKGPCLKLNITNISREHYEQSEKSFFPGMQVVNHRTNTEHMSASQSTIFTMLHAHWETKTILSPGQTAQAGEVILLSEG